LPTQLQDAAVSAEYSPVHRTLSIAVVLPTFNERENIPAVINRLSTALGELNWELIFVDDDSPDGTADVVRRYAALDPRIRLIQRVGRRGLSSACVEGMMATAANYIAVMDADLQHDETILPEMLQKLRCEDLDLVVATRSAEGGSMGEFAPRRVLLSRIGRMVSRTVCRCELTDPMSGFFLLRRSFLLEVVRGLHDGGFKILVDMLATCKRPVRVGEVGYTFRNRLFGESKLDVSVGLEYLFLVLEKLTGGAVPTRFFLFALVGSTGVIVHFAWLSLLYMKFGMAFTPAQAWATVATMTSNFFLNNLITYRDRRLHGVYLFMGMLTFWAACSFGAWANVSFAGSLLHSGMPWYLAGLMGNILSAVWNYSVSSVFTWQMRAPRQASEPALLGRAESRR
jgi:dolichol-phosphate mannosyltransferase